MECFHCRLELNTSGLHLAVPRPSEGILWRILDRKSIMSRASEIRRSYPINNRQMNGRDGSCKWEPAKSHRSLFIYSIQMSYSVGATTSTSINSLFNHDCPDDFSASHLGPGCNKFAPDDSLRR